MTRKAIIELTAEAITILAKFSKETGISIDVLIQYYKENGYS